jgi:CRISPR/Cas system type I-B associated protein Csh2 (Cas7 group RAMP superfamily)
MSTTRTLGMKFDTDMSRIATVSVQNCKSDLTETGVKEAMDVMIERQILTYDLTAKAGAQIVERTVTTLF